MLKLLSDLNLCQRVEISSTSVFATAVQGTWVQPDATAPIAGGAGFPIWTESNRDDTVGWTPDTEATGKLTILVGTHRAITDQYSDGGNIAIGTELRLDTSGLLCPATPGTHHVVAIAETAVDTDYEYLGTTYSGVITYITT
jgi:hypothetical protein